MMTISSVRITVLVDNHSDSERLHTEHGFACLVETDRHRVLFDTGARAALLHNASTLGIDLVGLDAIALSHGHYDHTGGLGPLGALLPKTRVVAHPELFVPHFSLSTGHMRSIGVPPAAERVLKNWGIEEAPGPIEVADGIWVTGEIPRSRVISDPNPKLFADLEGTLPDPLRDDMALVVAHERGLILLFGCAHAGVVNTMRYVEELFPKQPYLAILGGMHLGSVADSELDHALANLCDSSALLLGPGHCTGDGATAALLARAPQRTQPLRVGFQVSFTPTGRPKFTVPSRALHSAGL